MRVRGGGKKGEVKEARGVVVRCGALKRLECDTHGGTEGGYEGGKRGGVWARARGRVRSIQSHWRKKEKRVFVN